MQPRFHSHSTRCTLHTSSPLIFAEDMQNAYQYIPSDLPAWFACQYIPSDLPLGLHISTFLLIYPLVGISVHFIHSNPLKKSTQIEEKDPLFKPVPCRLLSAPSFPRSFGRRKPRAPSLARVLLYRECYALHALWLSSYTSILGDI